MDTVQLTCCVNMYVLHELINKVTAVIFTGFVFGILVLFITSTGQPTVDCGDTPVGLGCAIDQLNKYFSFVITMLVLMLSIVILFFRSLKIQHTVVISLMGAVSAISILLLYPRSYLFYNSYRGAFSYALLSSAVFYFSYVLCNRILFKIE